MRCTLKPQHATPETGSMGLKILDRQRFSTVQNKRSNDRGRGQPLGMRPDTRSSLVHPQSIIHSMVGTSDALGPGSALALPICATAIGLRHRPIPAVANTSHLNARFRQAGPLDFVHPTRTRFPALALPATAIAAWRDCRRRPQRGPGDCAEAFIAGQIRLSWKWATVVARRNGQAQMTAVVLSHIERCLFCGGSRCPCRGHIG